MPTRPAAALLCLFLFACDSPVGVAGVWNGSVGNTNFNLTLTETEQGVVSGAGRIYTGAFFYAAVVTGAHAHPAVAFNLDAPGVARAGFQGRFDASGTIMTGTLHGSGFIGDSVMFSRVTPPLSHITAP